MLKLPIYLDNHATTPVDPRVLEIMLPYFSETFGNAASRSHAFGWRAEEATEKGREQIARIVGASPKEIIFTSGATESDNLALIGVAEMYREKGNHIITTPIEHKAVLDTCKYLETKGFGVTYLPVDKNGRVNPDDLHKTITDKTILISIMHANNEIGTLQPLKQIGKIAKEKGVLFHSDAAQSIGKVPLNVEEFGLDLVSISAHKMYGPKGVGALYVRRKGPRVRLVEQIHGGGHERGMRSGTLNVPAIVGFGAAAELSERLMHEEAPRIARWRDKMLAELKAGIPQIYLNGHPTERLPGNLNVSFAYVEGESIIMGMKELAVSSGSACTSASLEPSYVLKAIGVGEDLAHTSIRFGIGRFNSEEEVAYATKTVIETITRLRELSPLWEMSQEGIDVKAIEWGAH